MTVSAFATAVVATAITAAVASATATFTAHHLHQFLNFFVGSRTAFQYFTFENQVGTSQRVIEVNYYNIRFDFYYAGIYALTVTSHQRYDVTFFNTFAVKLAIYFKNIFVNGGTGNGRLRWQVPCNLKNNATPKEAA